MFVYFCVCISFVFVHSGLELKVLCESIRASVRVLWAQRAAAQRGKNRMERREGGMQSEEVQGV